MTKSISIAKGDKSEDEKFSACKSVAMTRDVLMTRFCTRQIYMSLNNCCG